MFDLIITGGTAVMPASTESGRYRGFGRKDRRDRRARQSGGGRGRADGRCGGADRYPGRDRSAYPLRHADRRRAVERADLLRAPPSQVSKAALYGGTTTMLDFALCPPDQPLQQSIEARQREWAGACYTDYGFHLMLRGTQTPELLGALARGGAGGARDGENLHDRYPAAQSGPHGQVRRYLGSAEDHGARGRPRDDPRRGQRHRHAHVRKADPRGADRLREHGRGP